MYKRQIVRTIKGELTNQYNKAHQFKVGAEYRTTDITYNNITILQADYTDGDPVVRAPENNEIHNSFQSMDNPFTGNPIDGRHPVEFSAYIHKSSIPLTPFSKFTITKALSRISGFSPL